MRALARRLTCLPLSLGAVVAFSTPASATTNTPIMYFTAEITATYHRVCGNGQVRGTPALSPVWELYADGAQLPTGILIAEWSSDGGQTGTPCVTVRKVAPQGSYVLTFTFRDAAVNPLGPAPFAIFAHAAWWPGNPGTFVTIGTPP